MNNRLFIYGTLLNNGNEYALYLKNNSKPYSNGKIKGKLYNIGEYPGAILSDEGSEYIHGSILEINDPEKVLSVIDGYEGFGDDQPQPNEFIRTLAKAETVMGLLNCWVYLYNLSVAGLSQIKSGNYIQ